MRLFVGLLLLVSSVQLSVADKTNFYPLTSKSHKIPKLTPYQPEEQIPIECISRDITTGEHTFDDDGNIIYQHAPICKETNKPLSFPFGLDAYQTECTIEIYDELYHLLQLYIHEDSPFSCRIPIGSVAKSPIPSGSPLESTKDNDIAYVPLTFGLRGILQPSHLDIDNHLNVIFHQSSKNGIVSSIAYSSGTNTTRIIIGDELVLKFNVFWFGNEREGDDGLPYAVDFYTLSKGMGKTTGVLLILIVLFFVCSLFALAYVVASKRVMTHYRSLGYSQQDLETVNKSE